ncbi:Nif3-like dinuclear metal center hexameric protein [Thermodesulforhabdus norvegica]|uniref:GTP cyclohydrolase 1 type 2 homolog n=1 Tax=Thermodesulforhabdus norvegica TaxID=39841 RepID=A0A1I4SNU6_9BACT|nr:Nif3-like dinuclear metal center hexameric protein [Thermodesulforhabdus norvegica]SFM66188.1 dinuclear metal center protein, YbgI/SA1388 family [Thermodesulforhabdus norvegica]
MLTVGRLLEWIDGFAPFEYAEEWDRVGLQVGRPDATVKAILVSLDVTEKVVEEADQLGCNCIVSHHPLIFRPAEAIREDIYPTDLVCELVRRNIALIVAHTNLDCSSEGTNAVLAEKLSLSDVLPVKSEMRPGRDVDYWGVGVVGTIRPTELEELVAEVSGLFGGVPLLWAGDGKRTVSKVGICSGSGGAFVDDFVTFGADCLITGEVKYHDIQKAVHGGLGLIMVGHYRSEVVALERVVENLRKRAKLEKIDVKVHLSEKEVCPVKYYLPRR